MVEHPIEGLMNTAMNNLRDMIDVNTIVGEPIKSDNGTTIIPISKVAFGFAAGGSEFNGETVDQYTREGTDEDIVYRLPFGGGSGAGVSITPIGFLIVTDSTAKMLPVDHCSAIDKLLDYVPDLIEKISEMWNNEKVYKYEFYEDDDDEKEDTKCNCEYHTNHTKENEESDINTEEE